MTLSEEVVFRQIAVRGETHWIRASEMGMAINVLKFAGYEVWEYDWQKARGEVDSGDLGEDEFCAFLNKHATKTAEEDLERLCRARLKKLAESLCDEITNAWENWRTEPMFIFCRFGTKMPTDDLMDEFQPFEIFQLSPVYREELPHLLRIVGGGRHWCPEPVN